MQAFGVDVRLLPAGETFPALERGVIDAAEFVGPFLESQLGLHRVAKTCHTPGWHEPATASELIINKAAWASLPNELIPNLAGHDSRPAGPRPRMRPAGSPASPSRRRRRPAIEGTQTGYQIPLIGHDQRDLV